jgi:hypothetical protein
MYTNPNIANLPPPQITLDPLIIFASDEIVLSRQEAWCVLAYFFIHPGINAADLNENDLSFAQALLVEAIEQSYSVGFRRGNREIYLSKEMTRLAVGFITRTNGQWNRTAANSSIIKALNNHGGLHYLVRDKLSERYLINWMARVKTGIRAYG